MSALSRVLSSFPNDELNIVFNTWDVACTVFILQKQNWFNINSNQHKWCTQKFLVLNNHIHVHIKKISFQHLMVTWHSLLVNEILIQTLNDLQLSVRGSPGLAVVAGQGQHHQVHRPDHPQALTDCPQSLRVLHHLTVLYQLHHQTRQ